MSEIISTQRQPNFSLSNSLNWFIGKPIAFRLYILCVMIPTLLVSIYYAFIASDIYISEAKYSVRSNSESESSRKLFNSEYRTKDLL